MMSGKFDFDTGSSPNLCSSARTSFLVCERFCFISVAASKRCWIDACCFNCCATGLDGLWEEDGIGVVGSIFFFFNGLRWDRIFCRSFECDRDLDSVEISLSNTSILA